VPPTPPHPSPPTHALPHLGWTRCWVVRFAAGRRHCVVDQFTDSFRRSLGLWFGFACTLAGDVRRQPWPHLPAVTRQAHATSGLTRRYGGRFKTSPVRSAPTIYARSAYLQTYLLPTILPTVVITTYLRALPVLRRRDIAFVWTSPISFSWLRTCGDCDTAHRCPVPYLPELLLDLRRLPDRTTSSTVLRTFMGACNLFLQNTHFHFSRVFQLFLFHRSGPTPPLATHLAARAPHTTRASCICRAGEHTVTPSRIRYCTLR